MLLYTLKISDILEGYAHPVIDPNNPWKVKTIDDIITETKEKFFDFNFEWYSSENEGLENFKDLFLRYHYNDQIGQETLTLHKLCLQSEFNKIMPYYSDLWKSMKIEYDPLINRIRKTESKGNSSRISNSETNVSDELNREDNTQSVHSENPEVSVSDNNFASTMDRDKGTRKENQTGNTNTTMNGMAENSISESYEGFEGESQAKAIQEYRNNIININQRILEDTSFLFMKYLGGIESTPEYYLF